MRLGMGRVGAGRSAAGHDHASGRLHASNWTTCDDYSSGRSPGRLHASGGTSGHNHPSGRNARGLHASNGTAGDNHATRRGTRKVQARGGSDYPSRRSAGRLRASGDDHAAGSGWKPIAGTEDCARTVIAAETVGSAPIIRLRGTDRR
jgi:hypothetical protein